MLSAVLYESVVERDGMAALDRPVLDWMVDQRSPTLDTWVTHYTDLGSTTYMTPIVIVAAGAAVLVVASAGRPPCCSPSGRPARC